LQYSLAAAKGKQIESKENTGSNTPTFGSSKPPAEIQTEIIEAKNKPKEAQTIIG
jgi:hypothetical protein